MLLVAFGDSITAGVYVNVEEAFPSLLRKTTSLEVVVAGVPGNNTEQAKQRLTSDVINYQPDLVLIEFGMNDHYLVDFGNYNILPVKFKENLEQMILKTKEKGTKPFLINIQPVIEGDEKDYYYSRHPVAYYEPFGGVNGVIDYYNEIILELARNTNTPLIDINKAFREAEKTLKLTLTDLISTKENSGRSDGVHPTPKGHLLYAETILTALATTLENQCTEINVISPQDNYNLELQSPGTYLLKVVASNTNKENGIIPLLTILPLEKTISAIAPSKNKDKLVGFIVIEIEQATNLQLKNLRNLHQIKIGKL